MPSVHRGWTLVEISLEMLLDVNRLNSMVFRGVNAWLLFGSLLTFVRRPGVLSPEQQILAVWFDVTQSQDKVAAAGPTCYQKSIE
jgi:hypothetical protein